MIKSPAICLLVRAVATGMVLLFFSACESEERSAMPGMDYLAADQDSAMYRTGRIDPVVGWMPMVFDSLVFAEPEKYLPELAQYFRQNADNEYHVIKRIHDWITLHIAYEFRAETDAVKLLTLCRTNCVGYADLFRLLAGYAGIRAETVIGYSRTYMFNDGQQGNHAWNVVWVKGKPYIVDTTHDAGMRVRDNRVLASGRYSDDELFLNPKYKFSINLAHDDEYQLLQPARTYGEFMKQPRVRLGFFRHGLSIDDQAIFETRYLRSTPIRSAGISGISDAFDSGDMPAMLGIAVPDGVEVRATVQRVPEINDPGTASQAAGGAANLTAEEDPAVVLPEFSEKGAVFVFSPVDETGIRVNIEARFSGEKDWESVYSFFIARR